MRTTKCLWALTVCVLPVAVFPACGDDGVGGSGGVGDGGSPATTTSTVGPSTTSGSSTTSASTTTGPGTGGEGGEGGEGGAGGAPSNDVCPGPTAAIGLDDSVTTNGSTVGQTDDYTTFCADTTPAADTPDVVYELVLNDACTLEITLEDAVGFDGALSFRRTTCETRVGEDDCANLSTNDETILQHVAAGTYWIVVDGAGGTAGDFTLTASCSTPACGDFVVNPGEDCDNGPDVPNDGCSATCAIEAQAAEDACPGTPIPIDLNDDLFLPGAPALYANAGAGVSPDYQGSCMPETGGLDQVFHIMPTSSGLLTVVVGADYNGNDFCPPDFTDPACIDHALHLRQGNCAAAASEVACQLSDGTTGTTTLTFNVTAGLDYFLIVDGYNDQSYANGPYVLNVSLL